jgi:DNA modification methylase
MKVRDLTPNPENPRVITPERLAWLKKSLDEFGDLGCVVFNRKTRRLVGGHQRLGVIPPDSEIVYEEKYTQANKQGTVAEGVITIDGERYKYREVEWGVKKEKAANIAANKHGGEWDNAKLATWLIDLDGENIPWGLIGFEDKEIEDICAPFRTMPDVGEDEVPEAPKVACSKRGELYLLGDHRVLCGDSTSKEDVERLMAGERADMVFTDPPYNVGSETSCFAASIETRTKSMGKLKDAQWDKDFDPKTVFPGFEFLMSDDCTLYWCTSHHLAPVVWAWTREWATHSNYCVWSKPNPMPSLSKRHWTWNTELVCYATRGKHTFNFPDGTHAPSTWQFMKSAKCDLHPTMKPIEVIQHAISHSSRRGHLVADLFLGSGSTLIACEKTQRRCFGMEIAPEYIDVILDRFIKFTGKKVYRLNSDGSQTDWQTIKTERGEG